VERSGSSFNAVAAADAGNGGGNCAAEKLAGEPISRISFLDLQMHNLRRINERISLCDLWRRVFLTEVKTSDMFLAWCDRFRLTPTIITTRVGANRSRPKS
jgi:hypothetical protein